MNTYTKLTAAAGTALLALFVLAGTAGADSLVPTGGSAEVSTSFVDTVADAWPIMVAAVGLAILVKVVRKFI